MAIEYIYANEIYSSLEEAQAAVITKRDRLDTHPTDYATVKRLGGTLETGWIIPTESLNDSEILALTVESEGTFGVHSPFDGESTHGLTAEQAIARVAELKRLMGQLLNATQITATETISTNVDMTGYV